MREKLKIELHRAYIQIQQRCSQWSVYHSIFACCNHSYICQFHKALTASLIILPSRLLSDLPTARNKTKTTQLFIITYFLLTITKINNTIISLEFKSYIFKCFHSFGFFFTTFLLTCDKFSLSFLIIFIVAHLLSNHKFLLSLNIYSIYSPPLCVLTTTLIQLLIAWQ